MRRLVDEPLETFEALVARVAQAGDEAWESADHPPGCEPARGTLRWTAADRGGVFLHVVPAALRTDDFRLHVLFGTGNCVFGGAHDLFDFFNGPVARAFGIDVTVERSLRDDPPALPDALLPVLRDGERDETQARLDEIIDGIAGRDDAPPSDTASARVATPRPALKQVAERSGERARAVAADALAAALARRIHGQPAALERVARVVASQLAKTRPARPGCVLLLGPTGTGKTATVEALPWALRTLGHRGARVHRVDCSELTEPIQQARLLGSPPGYVGFVEEPPLFRALDKRGCILLLDEVEKAHPEIVEDVLLNLLDAGRLTKPKGGPVDAAHAVIAMTTNLAAGELDARLHRIAPENRWAVQQACRELLVEEGVPPELVGRIGAFAVFRPLGAEAMHAAALGAIIGVAAEYGLRAAHVDPVLADVVLDIAGASPLGARALHHAAAELLGEAFAEAAADGVEGTVVLEPGPPPRVLSDGQVRDARKHHPTGS